ncbi:MAG: hypothetical protein GYA77_04400 [Candidatus Cloacimonetes bacterium]|nr:hypothetical protein [Candidatus Cloacimonadota bacterium]
MMELHDRYVNNHLLACVSRPQHENSCSLTSLTAIFNYLYSDHIGIKTSAELASNLGIEAPGEFSYGPGNMTLLQWFDKLCLYYDVKGTGHIYLKGEDVTDEQWKNNAKVFSDLKEVIRSDDQALIYHQNNHYNLIVGYFEHSANPDKAYETGLELRRWIILGEHTEYNPIPKIIQKAMRALPEKVLSEDTCNLIMERAGGTPIWSRRWRSIRHDLVKTANHCILIFKR